MAEKENSNQPKALIEATPEEVQKLDVVVEPTVYRRKSREEQDRESQAAALAAWIPKTALGRAVREKKVTNYDDIIDQNLKVLESPIVDLLLKTEHDLLLIGQAKGKFGGGKRRAWRQTQKKTMEGNVVTFSAMAVVGDRAGHVGVGLGKAKETLPARAKAQRAAKLNIVRITRGWESKEVNTQPHTVPYKVKGKCGSVRVTLIPAPRGTGLVIGNEGKKILRLAGIEDVYSYIEGQTRTTFNLGKAVIDALLQTNRMRL
ncbi:30S ribosomal protein S5 [Candidatus Pacearchaeota archaeon]|nr:30S ribosomal protein S5 [Candidatus Pacearchaeota archaeon]